MHTPHVPQGASTVPMYPHAHTPPAPATAQPLSQPRGSLPDAARPNPRHQTHPPTPCILHPLASGSHCQMWDILSLEGLDVAHLAVTARCQGGGGECMGWVGGSDGWLAGGWGLAEWLRCITLHIQPSPWLECDPPQQHSTRHAVAHQHCIDPYLEVFPYTHHPHIQWFPIDRPSPSACYSCVWLWHCMTAPAPPLSPPKTCRL
jgi:hypothetical protein